MTNEPLTREQVIDTARALFQHYGWSNPGDQVMRDRIERMRDMALAVASETREPEITAKFLEECGYVRKGGGRLTFQGGDNIAPTAIEYYNPETGHAVLEFVSVQPLLLEKGKEAQYVKRYLYWAALTQEKK